MTIKKIVNNLWDKLMNLNALKKANWSEVLPFFLFIILALFFWLLIFFKRSEVGRYTIPIKYTNIPTSEVFIDNTHPVLSVDVKDKGLNIFRYWYKRTFKFLGRQDSIIIDVKEVQRNSNSKIQGNELTQLVRSTLPKDAEIIGYIPASISVKTRKLASKMVPVVFEGVMITESRNLIAGEATIIPSEVEIKGEKEQIRTITQVVTEHTPFENLKKTSQLPAKIKAIENIVIEPDEVEVYIPVYEYVERNFEIPITTKNSPKSLEVKFFPSKAKVSFLVTVEDYKTISSEDFKIVIDYNKLDRKSDQVKLELTKYPSTIKKPQIIPQAVEFLFEHK